jgi:two-component system response regulator DevR
VTKHQNTSVFISSSFPLLLDGMKLLLEKDSSIKVVGAANNLTDTIEQVRRLHPNVVLLDTAPLTSDGPNHSAFDAIVFMKRNDPKLRVMVMSLFGKLGSVDALKKVGVTGFVYPDYGFEQVLRMIRISGRPKRKRKSGASAAHPVSRRKASRKA